MLPDYFFKLSDGFVNFVELHRAKFFLHFFMHFFKVFFVELPKSHQMLVQVRFSDKGAWAIWTA